MIKMIFPMIIEEEERLPFYVTSIGANENQYHIHRPEGYPDYHFLYSTSGQGRLLIDGKDFFIGDRAGFFFQPGIPHEYYAETEPWTTWWVTFNGYAVKELLPAVGLNRYDVFHILDMDKLYQLHGDIHTAASHPSGTNETSHQLYRFLLGLRNCIGTDAQKTRRGNNQQLQPIVSFIAENYERNVTLQDMADVIGVTPQHLCRLFKRSYNMRPFEYLTRYRLQKAKEKLVGSGNPLLKEVALYTGFSDISYFCAVFRQHEGMTPVEFKRMHKEM